MGQRAKKPSEKRTVRVLITGRVQGVAYRAWVARLAETMELDGWVRNRRDGAVEALFSGPPDRVRDALERCRQGPSAARVESVTIAEEGGGTPPGFDVLPTA